MYYTNFNYRKENTPRNILITSENQHKLRGFSVDGMSFKRVMAVQDYLESQVNRGVGSYNATKLESKTLKKFSFLRDRFRCFDVSEIHPVKTPSLPNLNGVIRYTVS